MWIRENIPDDAGRMKRYEHPENSGSVYERVRDQSYIKHYNLQTVMATLKKYQPISRTDIARMTGMSPTSVTRIVNALLDHGLIYECAAESNASSEKGSKIRSRQEAEVVRRGRKAVALKIQNSGLYAIGIHLDKSQVRLCLSDFGDTIIYQGEMLVDGECTPQRMAQAAKRMIERIPDGVLAADARIGAVGVCLSGSVNRDTGVVRFSKSMEWENEPLRSVFQSELNMPVYVENDVKACLIGEKVRMDIRDEIDTVYLHIGNDIGAAIVSNGMVVRGRQNEAGNIGSVSMGEKDLLRTYLTQEGLLQRAQQKDSSVRTLDMLLRQYEMKQKWAADIVEDFLHHFNKTVSLICALFDPQKIILGGEIILKLRRYLGEWVNDERICFSSFHDESCMTGAALIALREAVVECIQETE